MMKSFEIKPAVSGKAVSASEPISIIAQVKGMTFRKPPMRRMSWLSASVWMTAPAHRNRSALKQACVKRWNMPAP